MAVRVRRSFTPAFKAQTVDLTRTSGKGISQVCRDLDLTETAVRRWVEQGRIGRGEREGLTTTEREELTLVRREVRVLQEEREILKEAAACFACMSPWGRPGRLARFFAARLPAVAPP